MRIPLRRGNCNFNRVLQDKWGSVETATGVHDYWRATGLGNGMLRVQIWAYVRA